MLAAIFNAVFYFYFKNATNPEMADVDVELLVQKWRKQQLADSTNIEIEGVMILTSDVLEKLKRLNDGQVH